MSWKRFLVAAILLVAVSPDAEAGAVLDRIRASKVIHCGGAPRPGLVDLGEDGRASGLYLDICRAVGAAVLGTEGRIEFGQYDSAKAYDAARNGTDDVLFLSAAEIMAQDLASKVLPGPPVFFESTNVMVSVTSPIQHVGDLAGKAICFSLGSSTQRHLEAWFGARHLDFIRMGYQEDVEFYDTYGAQVCGAMAAELTTLADVRQDGGVNHLTSRILPEPLAIFPIMAATPLEDPAFSAIVAWAVHSLVRAEAPAAPWSAAGLDSLRIDAPGLMLDKGWQARMIASTGSYGDMFNRNLGDASGLKLSRGLNAPVQEGGLFAAPYDE